MRIAEISKQFMEEIRTECDLENWPRSQSSMQSWLVFTKVTRFEHIHQFAKQRSEIFRETQESQAVPIIGGNT